MKANPKLSISLGLALLGMVTLATRVENEPKKVEVNVRAILREATASDIATKVAKHLQLEQSSRYSNGFNDLERPSVDYRGFTVSFTIDNASGKRTNYPMEVARSIARALKDAEAKEGNLDLYLAPKTPEFSQPHLLYRRGNVQGFVIIQMSNTKGQTEGVSIVCYEHVMAQSGIAEQDAP
ncbi:MAG: hypothetical protein V4689_22100 [Verrucomicrobiota bacterium]